MYIHVETVFFLQKTSAHILVKIFKKQKNKTKQDYVFSFGTYFSACFPHDLGQSFLKSSGAGFFGSLVSVMVSELVLDI